VTVAAPVGPPGQTVYLDACARCHGADLLGRGGTPALSSYRIASLGDQTMRLAIQYGKGEMPAFGGLTSTQVDDLISYLRTL
jgi:mono/diheme cytochrome c family protein